MMMMVLPPAERSSAEVASRWPHSRDERVPSPLRRRDDDHWSEDYPARTAGPHWIHEGPCSSGRHLFDVIESRIEREVETERDGWYEYEFRAHLTCVRCGVVLKWEGTRTETSAQLDPTPIVVGTLVAQHVSGTRPTPGDRYSRDHSNWTIFRGGAPVGVMAWGCTSRGRYYHQARLNEWPAGEVVEGADPAASLRKLARTGDRASAGVGA